MSKLSKRLQIIASAVTGKKIADVGCDHGKLVEYLLANNIVDSAIVSDISMPSLQKAIDLLSGKGYNFKYICCDGLIGYSQENIDECVISGMGGEEIVKIIKNSPIEINSFVLSPQHNNIMVKEFMLSLGYTINFDIIINDKSKFYNIFRCEKSDDKVGFSRFNLHFGKDNFINANNDCDAFVEKEILKTNSILHSDFDGKQEWEEYLNILLEYKKRK